MWIVKDSDTSRASSVIWNGFGQNTDQCRLSGIDIAYNCHFTMLETSFLHIVNVKELIIIFDIQKNLIAKFDERIKINTYKF